MWYGVLSVKVLTRLYTSYVFMHILPLHIHHEYTHTHTHTHMPREQWDYEGFVNPKAGAESGGSW